MRIQVLQEDFAYAREVCPADAPRWMVQEFAANHAIRRADPAARLVKVDRSGIEVDGRTYRRSLQLYLRRQPYAFWLSPSRLAVRVVDLLALLGVW